MSFQERWIAHINDQCARKGFGRVFQMALREEMVLSRIIITHNVVDVDNWLSFREERADAIATLGGSNVMDFVAQDGSNAVALVANVEDVAPLVSGLASPPPELHATMERHGDLPPLTIYIER
jgi:hypothetical protein